MTVQTGTLLRKKTIKLEKLSVNWGCHRHIGSLVTQKVSKAQPGSDSHCCYYYYFFSFELVLALLLYMSLDLQADFSHGWKMAANLYLVVSLHRQEKEMCWLFTTYLTKIWLPRPLAPTSPQLEYPWCHLCTGLYHGKGRPEWLN